MAALTVYEARALVERVEAVKVPRDGDVKPLGVVCPRLAKLVKTVCEQRLVVSLFHLCVVCTAALNGVVCAR